MGDSAMLQHARRAIAVGEHAYPSKSLQGEEEKQGWPVLRFIWLIPARGQPW